MITNFSNNTEEAGRSMVEMLGVLAIVGVLSIGGIVGYTKAMAKYKLDKTLNQISMIITSVHTTFGNQHSYAGLTASTAITYNIIGEDLSHGTTGDNAVLTNAFNGSVTIGAMSNTSTDCATEVTDTTYCPYFKIVYAGLPKQACTEVAMSDWGGSAASGLYSIKIGEDEFTWDGANKLPISLVNADSKCSDADTGNTITWIYN